MWTSIALRLPSHRQRSMSTCSSHRADSSGRRGTRTSSEHWLPSTAALVPSPQGVKAKLLIVGAGPEKARLRAHAAELGLADRVEFRSVPYESMPALYAGASGPRARQPCDGRRSLPRGRPPICSGKSSSAWSWPRAWRQGCRSWPRRRVRSRKSAAIRSSTSHRATGSDLRSCLWRDRLVGHRESASSYPEELLERYSTKAAADRLAAAYDRLAASSS